MSIWIWLCCIKELSNGSPFVLEVQYNIFIVLANNSKCLRNICWMNIEWMAWVFYISYRNGKWIPRLDIWHWCSFYVMPFCSFPKKKFTLLDDLPFSCTAENYSYFSIIEHKQKLLKLQHFLKFQNLGCLGGSVKHSPLVQVMISQLVSSSPMLGSVLTAWSLEPTSGFVSPSLSVPPLLVFSVSLSKINFSKQKFQKLNSNTIGEFLKVIDYILIIHWSKRV